MKNSCEKEKGITLMSLVITIVILLILASITTYSGIEVIKSSKLTTFTTEMKIMQTQVNELYQKMQDGDTTIEELGENISQIDNQTQVDKVFNAVGITTKDEREQYKYFDKDTIKKLNIEGVSGTFFVNIDKRSVISYEGFQYEDKYYYTLEQLPNGLYNVEHEKNTNEPPTFDTNVEEVSEGKWRITVSNIKYDGYINKWSVKYKLEDSDNWSTSEDLSFIVEKEGYYDVKIANNEYESSVKQLEVVDIYSKISPEVKALLDMGISIELSDINNDEFLYKIIDNNNGLVPLKNNNTNILSSSIYSSGYDAYMAFDKNNGSYWCTRSGQQNNAYIGYDFGEEQFISHCLYRYGTDYKAKEIKLQCSNDNNTWIDASENINLTSTETSIFIKNTKISQRYRYWRIYIVSSYTGYSVAHDLQFFDSKMNSIYNNLDEEIVSVLKNTDTILEIDDIISHSLLEKIGNLDDNSKKQIMSSNIIDKFKIKKVGLTNNPNDNTNILSSSIYGGSYNAYMAFDKNNASYWCTRSGQQNDAYIGYNFNKKTYIDSVDIYSAAYRCKEVRLQCSNDNNTWIDASDVVTFEDNNDIHTIESNIQDTPYQYWRVYVITGYHSAYTGIYECEFYGI